MSEALRADGDGVVESGGPVAAQLAETVVDDGDLVGEGSKFADLRRELQNAHLVLRVQDGLREVTRCGRFLAHVFSHAAAGVDGEGEIERHGRLAIEDGDLLRATVFEDGEVVFRQPTDDGAVAISDVDEDVDEVDLDMKRGDRFVLGADGEGREEPCAGESRREGREKAAAAKHWTLPPRRQSRSLQGTIRLAPRQRHRQRSLSSRWVRFA